MVERILTTLTVGLNRSLHCWIVKQPTTLNSTHDTLDADINRSGVIFGPKLGQIVYELRFYDNMYLTSLRTATSEIEGNNSYALEADDRDVWRSTIGNVLQDQATVK